jgi:hypothetical protein
MLRITTGEWQGFVWALKEGKFDGQTRRKRKLLP